jgi:two-component system sensor histidine kinase RegB
LNPDASLEIESTEELNEHLVFLDITIERALANLLDNAHGAGATKIVVRAGITSVSLTIQIDDNAAGISNSALQSFNLGAPFASDSGMGIGLLLSRTAVERKGGKLTLECLPKRGTRAGLVLPLNVA